MSKLLYNNVEYTESELLKEKQNVSELLDKYFEDPNCWPPVWISDEKITQVQKAAFIHFANIEKKRRISVKTINILKP